MRKRSQPEESIKTFTMESQGYVHYTAISLQTSEETNSPVYKLMADKLQSVLIIMLIRSILNTEVLQGSVATSLRCDGMFNEHCVALRSNTLNVAKSGLAPSIRS